MAMGGSGGVGSGGVGEEAVLVPVVYSPRDELERLVESVESVAVVGSERRVRWRPNVTAVNQYGSYNLSYSRLAFIDGSEDREPNFCAISFRVPVVYSPRDELERLVESVESVAVVGSERRVRCCVEPGAQGYRRART
jgi:hypothetical protein